MDRLRRASHSLLLLFGLLSLPPPGIGGQQCAQGKISYIFVDNRSVFSTQEMDPDDPFLWAYELANALHVRTREDFIRNEVLFRAGECLDSLRLAETERLLRGYRFIRQADVFSLEQPDGSQHVVVDTQDEWTTRFDLGIRLDEGLKLFGFRITEENFLGRGMRLRLFLDQEREQQDVGMEFFTPRIMNTRWDGRLAAGTTRNGNFFEEGIMYPFAGEVGRIAARQSFMWRESLMSYSMGRDPEHSNLLLPFLDQRADLALGGRVGRPGNLTVFGLGLSRESLKFRRFPDNVELISKGDYSRTDPADSAAVAAVAGQALSRTANRITLFLGQRNLAFVKRSGLDAFDRIQDVQIGTEIFFGVGRAIRASGQGEETNPDDLHAQGTLFFGEVWPEWTVNSHLALEGRRVYGEEGGPDRWEDVFGEGDLYLYWQPRDLENHTFLFRASGAGGWSVRTPFQLTLGGRTGVRGYRMEEFPGGRRLIFTLEDRIYLSWPFPEIFDFGLSFFADLGTIRAAEAPFGRHSGWRGSVGAGVRFGFPPGTSKLARVDLALPLGHRSQLKDLILRISLEELLGLLPGIRDQQLLRSLRAGLHPHSLTLSN